MFKDKSLSLMSLFRLFWWQISITWLLTALETIIFVSLPLLIGRAIDGLLNATWRSFSELAIAMAVLLGISVIRRLYDTRAYGHMRVELGTAVVDRAQSENVSTQTARLTMSRELVTFLETEAPIVLMAGVQVIVSILILYTFSGFLAASAAAASVVTIGIYARVSGQFYRLNGALNAQTECQVKALESGVKTAVRHHLFALKREEVRLSDTEAIVYGLIFAVLLSMLGFNLWFAATQLSATPGQIFSIITYSYEFIESAVMLPAALQSLTRISEITKRINSAADAA